jgi:hypothetical protein
LSPFFALELDGTTAALRENITMRLASSLFALSAVLLLSTAAAAQSQPQAAVTAQPITTPGTPQPGVAPSAPAGTLVVPAGTQLYPTPMQQTVQDSYVPQSVAMSGPEELDYSEGQNVPSGYHPETRVRKGLVIAGSATFGGCYLFSLLIAAAGQDSASSSGGKNDVAPLFIPVLGPFITMGNSSSATADVFLAIDGAAQAAGVAMAVVGLTMPRTILVRNDLGRGSAQVTITPVIGPGSAGIGGTF